MLSLICTAVLSLACGGVGGLGGGGSAKGQRLCEHLAEKYHSPCVSVGVGQTATISGFEVQVAKVGLYQEAEPFKGSNDERPEMAKSEGNFLALELNITNTKPTKRKVDFSRSMRDGDGDEIVNLPSPSGRYIQQQPGHATWINFWGDKSIGPDKSRMAGMTYPIHTDHLEGSLFVMTRGEKKPDPEDPRGRKKWFILETVVMDLGPPT